MAMTVLALGLPDHVGHSAGDTLRASLPHLLLYFVSMLGLAALVFDVLLPLLPVTGLSYRPQARFSRSAAKGQPD